MCVVGPNRRARVHELWAGFGPADAAPRGRLKHRCV